jgi:hypothetical protein
VEAALQKAEADAAARAPGLLAADEQDQHEVLWQQGLQALEKHPVGWQTGLDSMARQASEAEATLGAAETALRQWLANAAEKKRRLADCTRRAV